MLDDDGVAHVQVVFAKGGIGIVSFDETKAACLVDPTTMPADVFTACTGDVGLPTVMTKTLDDFDPSRPLENVYVVQALAPDGGMHWFGVVGLGPKESFHDALERLRGTWSDFGPPPSGDGSGGLIKPQFIPLVVAAGVALVESPEVIAGAVLVTTALGSTIAANRDALARYMTNLVNGSAVQLRSFAQADVDACKRSVTPLLEFTLVSVCLPRTPLETATLVALANYWSTGNIKVCAYSRDYFAGGAPNPGAELSNSELLGISGLRSDRFGGILWNRDKAPEPRLSSVVLPHEYGHLLQRAYGVNIRNPAKELQATCLAGFFAGVNRVAGLVALTSLNYSEGIVNDDIDVTSDSTSNYVAAHGTGADQNAAFKRGYESAIQNRQQVCLEGENKAKWALKWACNGAWFGGPGEVPVL
jgi:hypothetical protein